MKEFQGIEDGAYQATKRGIEKATFESFGTTTPPDGPPVARRSKAIATASKIGAEKTAPAGKAFPVAKTAKEKPAKVAKPAGVSKAKGEKRSPADLAALVDSVYTAIRATPGMGVEQIGKALAKPTKELGLPIKKLIKDRQITTKGQKRATRYFPK